MHSPVEEQVGVGVPACSEELWDGWVECISTKPQHGEEVCSELVLLDIAREVSDVVLSHGVWVLPRPNEAIFVRLRGLVELLVLNWENVVVHFQQGSRLVRVALVPLYLGVGVRLIQLPYLALVLWVDVYLRNAA